MKIKMWGIFQAVAQGRLGIGMKFKGSPHASPVTVFDSKEAAELWLANLIMKIKHEQGIGLRTVDNLVKETGLDWYISPVTIVADNKPMIERGWDFEAAYKYTEEHSPEEQIMNNIKAWESHKTR